MTAGSGDSQSAPVTVAISTKNRKLELKRALRSVFRQNGRVDVLVLDDGSTDGTSEMVRREFPEARLLRFEESRGWVARRNQAAESAAPILMFMDDDAEMASDDTLVASLADFGDPRVAAVAVPFIDVASDHTLRYSAPADGKLYVSYSFTGAAAIVRRDLFLALGGFRWSLGLGYFEEPDLCLRLLDAGYITRIGTATPLRHYESRVRDVGRNLTLVHRNDLLTACMTTPAKLLPLHLLEVTAGRRPVPFVSHTLEGYRAALRLRRERRPVSPRAFHLRQRLWKKGPLPLSQIEPALPPRRPLVGAVSKSPRLDA